MHMAKLTITRTNQWTNRFRSIDIYMDGKKLDEISNGETRTFDIEPGEHVFFVQGDWVTSESVTLQFDADSVRQFELGSPVKMTPYRIISSIILFALFVRALQLHDKRLLWAGFVFVIIAQTLDYIFTKQMPAIYYATFGRKKYLYLKEI